MKKNNLTQEEMAKKLKQIAEEMKREAEEGKTKFVKDLANEIVLKMVELGYTPKPKERDYIN